MREIKGYIRYFHLENWWLSVFSESERNTILQTYRYWENLTQEDIWVSTIDVTSYLFGLSTFFRRKEHKSIQGKILDRMYFEANKCQVNKSGYYKNRHYSTFTPEITKLKKENKNEQLEELLIALVNATEEEEGKTRNGVAPFYYKELAILYHKQKNYRKEVDILCRFAENRHAAQSVSTQLLLRRLEKAKAGLED